jgi:hypothetical protein
MRRLMILTLMLTLLLAVLMASPRAPRVVKAADPCDDCTAENYARFVQCQAALGENAQVCYDLYNYGVVYCYKTVCEQ